MSIPQRPTGSANPSQFPTDPTSAGPANQSPCAATLATLRAAARDAQVSRGALALLLWFATEHNGWRQFTVTALASPEMLNLSRSTIIRALLLIERRGYLEERKPRNARPGQREARLLLSVR